MGYRFGELLNPYVQPYIADALDALLLPNPIYQNEQADDEAEDNEAEDDEYLNCPRDRGANEFRRKPGSLGKSKGTDALRRENNKPRAAANAEGLNRDQARQLHDAISGQDLNYEQIREIAKQIKQGEY
jgi:anti-sigma28 factor (negative regulator of flagellin synthesis)